MSRPLTGAWSPLTSFSADSVQLSKEAVALFPPSGARLLVTLEPLTPSKLKVRRGSRLRAQAQGSAKTVLYYITFVYRISREAGCVHCRSFMERLLTQALASEREGNLGSTP